MTIWDADGRAYREIPVEDLQPGMILPGYVPETDSIEHGELIELQDAGRSPSFFRIHTDNGPTVDVTHTQPFDVLHNFGNGPEWRNVITKYLKPGMQMVRPFDGDEAVLSTITAIEPMRANDPQFFNPKVSHGRFVAAGYADWITK